MQSSLRFFLCSFCFLFFFSCNKQQSPFEISPVERLNPTRMKPPYPIIPIPGEADLESPRWKGISLPASAPVVPNSASEQMATFVLKPGFQIAPILTEPHIKEPAAIQFDGKIGRAHV